MPSRGIGRTISVMKMASLNHTGLVWGSLETPIGRLCVVVSPVGVRRIYFDSLTESDRKTLDEMEVDVTSPLVAKALAQLEQYFAGERLQFSLELDVVGTEFQRKAWHALAHIPYGQTATYGQQAKLIDRPRAVRAVGGANRMNPVPIVLPCHRVIGSDGSLTGFAGGLDTKKWLLQHEQDVVLRRQQEKK